ncbi:MAG: FtsQ-type POTRA domain-containing protein [Thermoplasmata archaeon]|nr:FtsQ-type POTRA domain-containing protein [Thermoplasmata archaeon]
MSESVRRRGLPVIPPADLPLASGDEPPFLRPKSRTRVRRGRRGWSSRAVVTLQVGVLVVLVVATLWAGYARVMASDRLKVGRVEVRGSRFLSEGEVRELLGPAVGENILGIDIDSLKGRLRSSPWVAEATVRRTLPDTLQVEIRERVPVALAEADGLYLMDGEGTLIELFGPRTAGFDLPIVRGLSGIEGDARKDRAQRAGALLRDLGDLGAEVSEVQFDESGDLRVGLRGAGEVLRMGNPPYRKKLLTFLGLRADLAQRCPKTEYFDLRFRDRIYANPSRAIPISDTAAARGRGR